MKKTHESYLISSIYLGVKAALFNTGNEFCKNDREIKKTNNRVHACIQLLNTNYTHAYNLATHNYTVRRVYYTISHSSWFKLNFDFVVA